MQSINSFKSVSSCASCKPPVAIQQGQLVQVLCYHLIRARLAPQAACIWLYTLVKQCSQHKAVQSQLLNIQRGFIRLLSDSDGKVEGFLGWFFFLLIL